MRGSHGSMMTALVASDDSDALPVSPAPSAARRARPAGSPGGPAASAGSSGSRPDAALNGGLHAAPDAFGGRPLKQPRLSLDSDCAAAAAPPPPPRQLWGPAFAGFAAANGPWDALPPSLAAAPDADAADAAAATRTRESAWERACPGGRYALTAAAAAAAARGDCDTHMLDQRALLLEAALEEAATGAAAPFVPRGPLHRAPGGSGPLPGLAAEPPPALLRGISAPPSVFAGALRAAAAAAAAPPSWGAWPAEAPAPPAPAPAPAAVAAAERLCSLDVSDLLDGFSEELEGLAAGLERFAAGAEVTGP